MNFCYKFTNSIKGNNCNLYDFSKIEKSELGDSCIVGNNSRVINSILGNFVKIDRNNLIYHSRISSYSYTGSFTTILYSKVKKFSSISWGVSIGPGEHNYNYITSHDFLYNPFYQIKPKNFKEPYDRFAKKVEIGNDVWIGTGSTILRGVKIGDGAVIGANSIVTKDVPPYAIVAGNPANILKYRFEKTIIKRLEELKWWDFSIDLLKEHFSYFCDKDIEKAIDNLSEIIKK
ncbi:MAG: DapH/DapD/GlmU-related protein [Candidatus Marithrix sp.]